MSYKENMRGKRSFCKKKTAWCPHFLAHNVHLPWLMHVLITSAYILMRLYMKIINKIKQFHRIDIFHLFLQKNSTGSLQLPSSILSHSLVPSNISLAEMNPKISLSLQGTSSTQNPTNCISIRNVIYITGRIEFNKIWTLTAYKLFSYLYIWSSDSFYVNIDIYTRKELN